MTNYLHSGNLGDIIYSMPFIRDTGGGTVYIKPALYNETYNQFDAARRLLLSQRYISNVLPYPNTELFHYDPEIRIDYDLDLCRKMKRRGSVHLIKQYYLAFDKKWNPKTWWRPWIEPSEQMFEQEHEDYTVINLTPRWREGSWVNWRKVVPTIEGKKCFVGFDSEYNDFVKNYGPIDRVTCTDLYQMALLVYYSKQVYCNQSVCLTLAQGLGKKYFLERKGGRKNCLMFTFNETILK